MAWKSSRNHERRLSFPIRATGSGWYRTAPAVPTCSPAACRALEPIGGHRGRPSLEVRKGGRRDRPVVISLEAVAASTISEVITENEPQIRSLNVDRFFHLPQRSNNGVMSTICLACGPAEVRAALAQGLWYFSKSAETPRVSRGRPPNGTKSVRRHLYGVRNRT